MALSIYASTDHASPYPIVPSAPCCGRSITDYEPVPPGWMLLDGKPLDGLAGMVTMNREVMHPTLRGVSGVGCACGPSRINGLGAFEPSLLERARALASEYVPSVELPPSPADVIDSIWRLAEVEREIILLRRKLRRLRSEGALLSKDVTDFDTLRRNYYKAALAFYTPVLRLVAAANPLVLRFMPTLTMPAGIDGPDEDPPWVPNREDLARIRNGDLTGFSRGFQSVVDEIQRRLAGGGVTGLGDIVIGGVTISTALLACIVVVAIVVVVIALAVNAQSVADVMTAWAQSFSHARTLDARASAYRECMARPGATSAECGALAERLAPPPQFRPLGSAAGLGFVVGAVAVGAAWYFLGTEGGRARAGLSGLRRRRRRR